jgi:signal transduction histidine kinase
MISHDLRTPLAGARAGIGMLEASTHARLQPDERELLASTRRNIQRLGRLIDDLLTLNQLEVGAIQLTRAPLDLRTVVADILPTVHPLIAEKEQLLEVDLPDPLPVVGDVRRLEQVVLNLVANAHQHTPSGTRIVVSGDVEDGRVRLCICDTGLGIPPTERDRIFERFYQVGKGRGAAGLGLAIVKGLVELHAGRVWVESTPHDGTTFTVALPRSTAQEHADV